MREVNVSIISNTTNIIEGSERAIILLPRDTILHIKNVFCSPKSNRNLLSFKDIRLNGYILRQTMKEILNIFISLELSQIKNMYWRNYQPSLMTYTTHIY